MRGIKNAYKNIKLFTKITPKTKEKYGENKNVISLIFMKYVNTALHPLLWTALQDTYEYCYYYYVVRLKYFNVIKKAAQVHREQKI